MDLFIDPASRTGKSNALYDQLREAIASGRLSRGDRLPTSRALAAELGLSRNTITTVYGRLVAEGFITGCGSAGSFVSDATAAPADAYRPSALAATNVGFGDVTAWSLGEFATANPVFDLRTGRPDPMLFPRREWRRCVVDAFDAPPSAYGHPAGLPTLRRAIARWIGRSRGVEADADQVIITAGAQQGVDLVARLMLCSGECVAVEDPGYPPVANLLGSLGAVVAPVRVDESGIVVEEIPETARMVYVTPSHQAPTGVALSMERRRALLDLAADRGIAIIEDDYDTEYRHGNRPLEPIYRLDLSGRVIYVGTFSKTLTPSLRLGFVVLPPSLVSDAVTLRCLMDWQPPAISQHALYRFIVDGHLERHLRRTRSVYTARYHAVLKWMSAQRDAGSVDSILPSQAGLHITAMLGVGLAEDRLRRAAAGRGVALGYYRGCWRSAPDAEGITIGFGAVGGTDLDAALEIVARCLNEAG